MTHWSSGRERRAIVAHLARCSFCRALFAHGRRRHDQELLDAADQLAAEHALADAEREAFGTSTPRTRHSNRPAHGRLAR